MGRGEEKSLLFSLRIALLCYSAVAPPARDLLKTSSFDEAASIPEKLKKKSFKGLRFQLINLSAQVVKHARGLFIKLCGGKEVFDFVYEIRQKIENLSYRPPPLATG